MSELLKPQLGTELPVISHGQGMYLYDTFGRRYIDGCSGAITANIGHGIPEIKQAISKQMDQISFVYRSQFTNAAAESLATALHEQARAFGDYVVFFVNSGSEATETALKMVWQSAMERGEAQRSIIISRQTSYHGITLGALALSKHEPRRSRFEPYLMHVPSIPMAHCTHCSLGLTHPDCQLACLDPLERLIEQYGAHRIAAIITEPVVGAAGGAIVSPVGYEKRLEEICRSHGIAWIADEVMCGGGRTGTFFAVEAEGASPDVILLGKGLAAGYAPLAAVMVKRTLMDPIVQGSGVLMAGHTHCANPMSAAAGLAVFDYLMKNRCMENATHQGDALLNHLQRLSGPNRFIRHVRGRGLFIGVEWNPRWVGTGERLVSPARLIADAFRSGMLLYPAGGANPQAYPSVIVAPPLTISNEDRMEIEQWWSDWIFAQEQRLGV